MQHQRKRLFVDRSVQGAILWRLAMHWMLFLVAGCAFLFFVEMLNGDPRNAGRNALTRHGPTLLAVLALAPIFICDLCKLTNRFAGPMIRLRRAMNDLAEGREVKNVHFRDGDFWKNLDVDFNRVVGRLRSAETPLLENTLKKALSTTAVRTTVDA